MIEIWDLNKNPRFKPEKDRLTRIHHGMRQRCNNPNNPRFKDYGGRGVNVCDEWNNPRTGVKMFRKWAVYNGYMPTMTIDRIDPDGNYEPSNCRWITRESNSMKMPDIECYEADRRKKLEEQYPEWV